MHEKSIQLLADQIAKLKAVKGKSARLPKKTWAQIAQLRTHFTPAQLASELGISVSGILKKTSNYSRGPPYPQRRMALK